MTLWENESTNRPHLWIERTDTSPLPMIGFDVYLSFNKDELKHLKACAKTIGYGSEEDLIRYIKFAALGPNYSPPGA